VRSVVSETEPILGADWRALTSRGLDSLSPPELDHALVELLADRPACIRLLEDFANWPARPTLTPYVPSEADTSALASLDGGGWRAVVLLDDQRALHAASVCFSRVFVLDPLFDSAGLLYAAWHDPQLQAQHAERLAAHVGLLARLAPLLRAERAVLTPDHLPGSWSPRANWRQPPGSAPPHLQAAWSLRCAVVLVYWADRLDATVCIADRSEVGQALETALRSTGPDTSRAVSIRVPSRFPETAQAPAGNPLWTALQRARRRRGRAALDAVACLLESIDGDLPTAWRLQLAQPRLPEPALLLARAVRGEDPGRAPALPRLRLRRSPLVLVGH
jgi:hypothetical protein